MTPTAPRPTHTPGPWMSFDSGTKVITCDSESLLIASLEECEVETVAERKANAEFIVRACNSHEELVEALRDLLQVIATDELIPESVSYMQQARAALAKAEGR